MFAPFLVFFLAWHALLDSAFRDPILSWQSQPETFCLSHSHLWQGATTLSSPPTVFRTLCTFSSSVVSIDLWIELLTYSCGRAFTDGLLFAHTWMTLSLPVVTFTNGRTGMAAMCVASCCFFICGTSLTNLAKLSDYMLVMCARFTNSFSTTSLSKSCIDVLEIVSSGSSIFCSAVWDAVSSPCSWATSIPSFDCSSLAYAPSSSVSIPSPLTMRHLDLRSVSPSSITMSESESGSIQSTTVLLLGIMLILLLGTTAWCFSISMISSSVIQSMSCILLPGGGSTSLWHLLVSLDTYPSPWACGCTGILASSLLSSPV